MPVTKKKGAIFAIYADSPSRPTGASSISKLRPTSTSINADAHATASSSSPTKKSSIATRRPLTSLQPTKTRSSAPAGLSGSKFKVFDDSAKISPDVQDTKVSKSKSSTNATTTAKPSLSSSTKPKRTPLAAATKAKRQFEIFSDPSPAPPVVASAPNSSKDTSPLKRSRLTPRKKQSEEDKENAAPTLSDSPASRTRSKTASQAAQSPIKDSKRVKGGPVRADAPLADVSSAYGATGEIPSGFKTQGIRPRRPLGAV
ncbi:hypothetical protein DB88DRAFT_539550 [Papiliotrema laurentii]|uniref:Uncharacterized protein n=1 Tax=Papiliotrema laurentii TaxID=5418 RepID=A0AAD9L6W0_PAPLA|nr:hypothetical protein DB88DRAFT_539550 [Papiliotrema laurentii]